MLDKQFYYQKIGLKCGLEIHQQLDSKKLFCNCPSVLRKDEPDFEFKRKLHLVAGEAGEIDIAAIYQSSLKKEFIYQGYDTTCLVELDEEPPHKINKEALNIALHISFLLNCQIVPFTQIMRKTVIDGSNTSGFQRTLLVGRDGWIKTGHGNIGINYVYLEEDAARKISEENDKVIYRIDRLGIPLVEIVTAPDIKTPDQAKEVALLIGELLRSCKVKRGLGTIRQDINISIKGHPRVEIKGFQDPKIFVKVVEKEVKRQLKNLQEKKVPLQEVRGANPDASTKYLRPLPGAARMYPETDLPLLKISKDMVDYAKKTLPKLKKDIKKELERKGLNQEMIKLLISQKDKLEEFKCLLNVFNNPDIVAKCLLIYQKEISRKYGKTKEKMNKISNIINNSLEKILNAVKEKKILPEEIKKVMEDIASGKDVEKALNFKRIDKNEAEEKILKVIKEKQGLSENAYMGLVMKEFRGKISGKEAINIIRKFLKTN